MSSPRRIVIVGSGIAGSTAASELREVGFDGELSIIGDEPHRTYSRPTLSKAALLSASDLDAHLLPEASHGATELRGVTVTGLDLEHRRVLIDHDAVPFDGLIIASGSHAKRLGDRNPMAQSSAELTLRNLDDAGELKKRLAARPSVVVIGGGALGIELASGCLASGCDVTLITRRDPLRAQLGDYLSAFSTRLAREAGVRLLRSNSITVIDRGDSALIRLDEEVREASLVLTAIGDRANTEWLRGTGIALTAVADNGIAVNAQGMVRPGIVAAGDVAAVPASPWLPGTSRGAAGAPRTHHRIPLWTSAIEQAKTAARALILREAAPPLDFQPYFWTEQFGVSMKICGALPPVGEPEILEGDPHTDKALLRWGDPSLGTATVAALGMRIPIPRLRAHTRA